MCKFIGKSNEWIFSKLSKSEILRLYSIVRVAIETTKMPNFTCQSKSFISIFFTCQVSACEMQPFSCHDLANDMYSQTAKIVFSRLNKVCFFDNDNSINDNDNDNDNDNNNNMLLKLLYSTHFSWSTWGI